MCSRVGFYSGDKFVTDMNTLIESFNSDLEFTPSYNIAPSQPIATVLNNGSYQYTHFGFIPNWATDKKRIQVNARSESVHEKVMFKDSIKTKRCIIPVNGFYEWSHQGNSKTPYWFYPTNNDYFALAGIYDEWYDAANNEIVTSSAIITTQPNDVMSPIHSRMPLILKQDDWNLWLQKDLADVKQFFRVYDNELIRDRSEFCVSNR